MFLRIHKHAHLCAFAARRQWRHPAPKPPATCGSTNRQRDTRAPHRFLVTPLPMQPAGCIDRPPAGAAEPILPPTRSMPALPDRRSAPGLIDLAATDPHPDPSATEPRTRTT